MLEPSVIKKLWWGDGRFALAGGGWELALDSKSNSTCSGTGRGGHAHNVWPSQALLISSGLSLDAWPSTAGPGPNYSSALVSLATKASRFAMRNSQLEGRPFSWPKRGSRGGG